MGDYRESPAASADYNALRDYIGRAIEDWARHRRFDMDSEWIDGACDEAIHSIDDDFRGIE